MWHDELKLSRKENTSKNESCKIKDLEQEKILSLEIIDSLINRTEIADKHISATEHVTNELKQENTLLSEEIQYSQKIKHIDLRKYLLTVAIIGISLSLLFVALHYPIHTESAISLSNYKSQYVIQNLKGDRVDTWVAWNIPKDDALNVQIVDNANLPKSYIDAIEDSILSLESIEIDDSLLHKGPKGSFSTYYLGWSGALSSIAGEQTLEIPKKFNILDASDGVGDIVITLHNFQNPDGYLGWTQSQTDNNQVIKSSIGIYQADEISAEELKAIIRHEFGHALGLAHSSAPEDLMAPVIETDFPYISQCDIDAILSLYDDNQSSHVICEK